MATSSSLPGHRSDCPAGSSTKLPPAPKACHLWIGYDSEYVQRPGSPNGGAPFNEVLSYQVYCIEPITGRHIGRVILANGRRLSLARLIGAAVEASLGAGVVGSWPGAVVLVGHFTLADLCALRDFHRLKNQLDAIRGTYMTLAQAKRIVVHDSNRNAHAVRLVLRDTTCLAPDGSRTLGALQTWKTT
jgi:hypothetical protein